MNVGSSTISFLNDLDNISLSTCIREFLIFSESVTRFQTNENVHTIAVFNCGDLEYTL